MSKATILIVEDESIISLDIRNSLERSGYQVAGQADRGEDAIKQAGELHPDLILMDIGLKGNMDGIAAAEQIRTRFDLPVIFLTSYSDQSTLERARVAEPFGYILKPFEERELVSNIEMTLYKHTMERKLRESEYKFRSVIENSSDGIALIDRQGNLIEWNLAAEEISGLKRSDVLGQPIATIISRMLPIEQRKPAFLETLKHQLEKAIENEYASALDQMREVEIETSQGVRRVVQNNGFRIALSNETLAGVTMRDITERKQIEIERGKFINVLKSKNTELEQFTHTVSHDLKAPLATISGFLGYLEKDVLAKDPEKIRKDIEHINNAVIKMSSLLRDLLELSRIGRIVNPSQEVSFEEIARDAIELVSGRILEKKVRVNIGQDLPTINGDRVRLTQVMQNLIDNAVKFMGEQPEPRIEIGYHKASLDHDPVFFVRDNGIGIATEYQDRVFGLFDKLDLNAEGTGIGLALVKRIIEAHNGTIWVESEGPGKGSTFCFTTPDGRE